MSVQVPNEAQGPSFSDRLVAHITPRTDAEVVEVCKRVTSRQAPGFTPGESGAGGKGHGEVKPEGEVYKGKVYYTNADPVVCPLESVHAQVLPLRTAERSLRRTESMSKREREPSSSAHQKPSSACPTPVLTPSNSIRSSTRSLPPTPAPDKPLPPLPKDRDDMPKGPKLLTRLRSVRDLPRIEDLSLDAETEADLGPFLDYLAIQADPKTPLAPLPRQDANPTKDADAGSVLDDLTREADDLISEYASLATAHDASTAPDLSTDDDDDIWYEELTSWEYAAGRQAEADRQRDEMVRAVREAEEERAVRERGERVRAREERVRALVEARREEVGRGREGRK